jgi:hypothetical protein
MLGSFGSAPMPAVLVHAERRVPNLMPPTPGLVKPFETLREPIWYLYSALQAYRRSLSPAAVMGL